MIPFVVPGLVYLAWRMTTRAKSCPVCGKWTLIPSDAPLARTWRSAGWVPGQPLPSLNGQTDPRIERIEQAIDAIAIEVDRVGRAQRESNRLPAP